MTDEDIEEVFDGLSRVAREAGLGWVVDETVLAIEEGYEQKVQMEIRSDAGKLTKGDTRLTRREYSSTEQTLMLLDSVERVVRDGGAIEAAIAGFFAEKQETPDNVPTLIRFAPPTDRPDNADDGFEIGSQRAISVRASAIANLTLVIESVRQAVAR